MTRPAFYWIMGGIAAVVVIAVFTNPIAAIIAAILGGLAIDRLERYA